MRAPRYKIANHHPELITPGYWFVTPYTDYNAEPNSGRRENIPYQTGPHIYDGNGSLIWSGADKFDNRNTFGLKPITIDGVQHLQVFVSGRTHGDRITDEDKKGAGLILNSHYDEIHRIRPQGDMGPDLHEFDVQPNGKTVILSANWNSKVDASTIDQEERVALNNGFQEIDLSTGDLLFKWDAIGNGVTLNESCNAVDLVPDGPNPLDFFHINSIDKDADGDYLVSARHTSTLYKISGQNGQILWRLGGYESDFAMDEDVPFHWQHHSRLRFKNETHTIISVFDNASEEYGRNADIPPSAPVGKLIALDHTRMTASILRQFARPDGGRSPLQGSVQPLGTDLEMANIFIDWAMEGYISEYDARNRMVFEARFLSNRFRTYRAHKYLFKGFPTEPPAFKVLPIGYASNDIASAFYVSWNGATEVVSWAFYGADAESGPFKLLATVKRSGFETSWVTPGLVKYAYAEALDSNDASLGKSPTTSITPPADGNYTMIVPLLENSNLDSGLNMGHTHSGSTSLEIVMYLMVGGFAIFGAYTAVRGLISEVIRRRREEYMEVPSSDNVEEYRDYSGDTRVFAPFAYKNAPASVGDGARPDVQDAP